MKKRLLLFLAVFFLGMIAIFADEYIQEEKPIAIIVDRDVLEESVCSMDPQEVTSPGKIFIRGNLLFVVEQFYGVHVFNNFNPDSPQNIGFIRILGCTDVAVKENTLFASSAVDLVRIDISNISDVKEISRNRHVLQEIVPSIGYIPHEFTEEERPYNTEIIAWKSE